MYILLRGQFLECTARAPHAILILTIAMHIAPEVYTIRFRVPNFACQPLSAAITLAFHAPQLSALVSCCFCALMFVALRALQLTIFPTT